MKLSAFTIIKNAVKYDFPVVESINSLIDIVDEYVVNLGQCDDGTYRLLMNNFGLSPGRIVSKEPYVVEPKIKWIFSEWEGKGTSFISEETNKALNECAGDWVIYLQADEVIHEDDLPKIKQWIEMAEKEGKHGITLKYLHFAGDPNHVYKDYKDGFDHYDKELRIFRNTGELFSFGDGQSFSFLDQLYDPRGPQPALHKEDRFLHSDIRVFHYSYLRDKKKLLDKKKYLQEFYNISEPDRKEEIKEDKGVYFIGPKELKEFGGDHPKVMKDFVKRFQ